MSWDRVKPESITKCFKKSGFYGACDTPSDQEDDIMLRILDWDHLNVDGSSAEIVCADDHMATCKLWSVEDIIAEATTEDADHQDESTEDSGDDDQDDGTEGGGDSCGNWCSTAGHTLTSLDTLQGFIANAQFLSEEMAASFFIFQKNLFTDVEKKVQQKLTSYFKVAQ